MSEIINFKKNYDRQILTKALETSYIGLNDSYCDPKTFANEKCRLLKSIDDFCQSDDIRPNVTNRLLISLYISYLQNRYIQGDLNFLQDYLTCHKTTTNYKKPEPLDTIQYLSEEWCNKYKVYFMTEEDSTELNIVFHKDKSLIEMTSFEYTGEIKHVGKTQRVRERIEKKEIVGYICHTQKKHLAKKCNKPENEFIFDKILTMIFTKDCEHEPEIEYELTNYQNFYFENDGIIKFLNLNHDGIKEGFYLEEK